MTLEEYQQKYSTSENVKIAKSFLSIFAAAIGLIIFACLFFIVLRLFEIHMIAGYVGIVLAIIIFILVYILPIVKLKNTKSFITNVNHKNAKQIQRYNKQLREDIADKMIDITAKTENIGWYSSERVGKLAIARQTKNDKELKNVLTEIYNVDVKAAANKMIREQAFKVGFKTALSQSDKLDTLLVSIYELNLIKDIVFLYGYRPSDAQLARIYKCVICNALIAYGVQSATSGVANAVIKKMGDVATNIPILGSAIGTVIDSSLQGVINASLTVVIGFQTKKYLKSAYNLQDILDEIDLSDDDEAEVQMMEEVKSELSKNAKKKQTVKAS